MPPALPSDNESASDDGIPAQKRGKAPQVPDSPAGEDEVDSDEEAEDEYVVEKIVKHDFKGGNLRFYVKWQGYDSIDDYTWEPEDNLEGAADVLREYFEEIGGRPEPKGTKGTKAPKGQKRKGRASEAPKSTSGTPVATTKRVKQEKDWSPPQGSWEDIISNIDTIEETRNPQTGAFDRFVYLVWKNGRKTQHPLKHAYKKCPEKMLEYYESHLVFTHTDDSNGGESMMKDTI